MKLLFHYWYFKYFSYCDLSANQLISANLALVISCKYKKEELDIFSTLAYMCVTSSFLKEQGFGKNLSALEYSLPKNYPSAGHYPVPHLIKLRQAWGGKHLKAFVILAGHQIPKRSAINRMPFVAALELSLAAKYCQVCSEQFNLFANETTPKWNGDLRKGVIAVWIPKWMLNGTVSRSETNGSFPSPCLSWATDHCYMVYLQCLSPFLSKCSQAVPLVTYLLASIIDTCSIMVVQFTKKE